MGVTVVRRLAGGEWGAFLVTTAQGSSAVLKPLPRHELVAEDRVRQAVEFARALRADGYPIPAYLQVGVVDGQVFTLQEAIEGEVPARLRLAHVRRLIELSRRHVGLAPPDESWGEQLVAEIRPDASQTQTSIRNCGDPRVISILDEALAVGERTDPTVFRCDDIVHNDFHHANLLVRGDEVVAVFDWEGAQAGDCRADLTTLAWYLDPSRDHVEPAARALLRAEIDTIQPEVRAALAARFAISKLAFAVNARPQVLPQILRLAQTWLRPQW
nr:phosphotransferase [Actinopolymorpha rutila]